MTPEARKQFSDLFEELCKKTPSQRVLHHRRANKERRLAADYWRLRAAEFVR